MHMEVRTSLDLSENLWKELDADQKNGQHGPIVS